MASKCWTFIITPDYRDHLDLSCDLETAEATGHWKECSSIRPQHDKQTNKPTRDSLLPETWDLVKNQKLLILGRDVFPRILCLRTQASVNGKSERNTESQYSMAQAKDVSLDVVYVSVHRAPCHRNCWGRIFMLPCTSGKMTYVWPSVFSTCVQPVDCLSCWLSAV